MRKTQIVREFEQLSLVEKVEFLDDYDIDNDLRNKDYFVGFIKEIGNLKDYWYQSLVIDIASELQINDDRLFEEYFNYLLHPVHYLVKLSVLDFQLETYHLYFPKKQKLFIQLEDILSKKNERLVVKNQVLINLMIYKKDNRLKYKMKLIENLKRTSDYRSHLRVLNTFMNYSFFDFITRDYIEEIIKVIKKWKFGKSVTNKIIEAKSYW